MRAIPNSIMGRLADESPRIPDADSLVPGAASSPALATENAPVNARDKLGMAVHPAQFSAYAPSAESITHHISVSTWPGQFTVV